MRGDDSEAHRRQSEEPDCQYQDDQWWVPIGEVSSDQAAWCQAHLDDQCCQDGQPSAACGANRGQHGGVEAHCKEVTKQADTDNNNSGGSPLGS